MELEMLLYVVLGIVLFTVTFVFIIQYKLYSYGSFLFYTYFIAHLFSFVTIYSIAVYTNFDIYENLSWFIKMFGIGNSANIVTFPLLNIILCIIIMSLYDLIKNGRLIKFYDYVYIVITSPIVALYAAIYISILHGIYGVL